MTARHGNGSAFGCLARRCEPARWWPPARSRLSDPPSSSRRGRDGGCGEQPRPPTQVSLPRSQLLCSCRGDCSILLPQTAQPCGGAGAGAGCGSEPSPSPDRRPGDPTRGGWRSAGHVPGCGQQRSSHLRGIPACPTRVAAGAPGVSGAVPVVPVQPPAPCAARLLAPGTLWSRHLWIPDPGAAGTVPLLGSYETFII